MPSKKSKPTRKARPRSRPAQVPQARSAWKAARSCSEDDLRRIAAELAKLLQTGDRVLLEGPLGAGKTTLSKMLLAALHAEQPPEGSPTFAIAHEYRLGRGLSAVHVDLYRIQAEEEIDERGLPEHFWDSSKIVLCEWSSLWAGFREALLRSGRNWLVELEFAEQGERLRDVKITRPA